MRPLWNPSISLIGGEFSWNFWKVGILPAVPCLQLGTSQFPVDRDIKVVFVRIECSSGLRGPTLLIYKVSVSNFRLLRLAEVER